MRNPSHPSFLNCLLLSSILLAGTLTIFLVLTWELGTDWGPFTDHFFIIAPALFKLTLGDSILWAEYWSLLGQHGYQLAFVIHTSIPVIASGALAIKCFIVLHDNGNIDCVRHISGPQLYKGKHAYRHAMERFREELRHDKKPGIKLHPRVPITLKRELGNVSIVGKQGSGKSVIVKYLLSLILLRFDKALVFDEKREYVPFLLGSNSVLICPSDFRSGNWLIALDADSPERALLCSTQMVTVDSSNDPMWTDGARLILAGCICALNAMHGINWGWPELQTALEWEKDELFANLDRYYPRTKRLIVEHCRTTDGFLMNLTTRLGWVGTLATAWPDRSRKPFSIREWVTNPSGPNIVIIANDPQHSAISGPMCAAFLSLMTSDVLSLSDSDERRMWFVMDELASFPKCDALEDWLSKGRSKGARTIAGYQSYSQLDSIYGTHDAQTIMSLFSNVIGLQCGAAGGSAERTARGFGEQLVERPVHSVNSSGEWSTSFQQSREPLVVTEDLVHLDQPDAEGVTGYLCTGGTNSVYRLKWPYPSIVKESEDFLPADWLKKAPKQPANRRRGRRA